MPSLKKRRIHHNTPDWLIEVQNKSWEPEIIISGITLTFLFILSDYAYNFFGMLVQDFGVYEIIAKMLYRISIILLTGFKIILIVHLVLRGFWTGMIGLSYVFPHGVKTENLILKDKTKNFFKPEKLIIKFEKICSLLFSFIFSTILFIVGFLLMYIPIVLLFILGLDLKLIHIITSYVILPVFVLIGLLLVIFSKKISGSQFDKLSSFSFLSVIIAIYYSNVGKIKTTLIYIFYFLIILLISLPDLKRFDFRNKDSAEIIQSEIPHIDKNQYEKLRNQEYRISQATINQYQINDTAIDLFISIYKEDNYTLQVLKDSTKLLADFSNDTIINQINLTTIHKIFIDSTEINNLNWHTFNHNITNQKGLITKIPIEHLNAESHNLFIHKLRWFIEKEELKIIKNWAIIPFVKINN